MGTIDGIAHPDSTRGEVGRLAPSPTGGLHVGHARTFLVAWLMARGAGGRVVLRVEDIDSGRVRPGMAERAAADLSWLGLDWDEGPDVGGPSAPYVQSERLDRYAAAIERLKAAELVYPCTCSRADIRRLASAPHVGEEGPIYPGTCSGRTSGDAARLAERRFSWRFRAGHDPVSWDDLFLGTVESEPASAVGDFIVGRSDGGPSYQLAVVVDDAAMGITQVVRGDDLVSSTPRQLALYGALGLAPPRFGHVALVIDRDGRRLAKRDESIKLASLRDAGIDPMGLMRSIGRSIGIAAGPSDRPSDWIGRDLIGSMPRDVWVFDPRSLGIDPERDAAVGR